MDNITGANDQMLEMFLFEGTSLLEQLDDILLSSEKKQSLTGEDVGEIFRIMHTIKGSSAMMEYHLVTNVTHRLEDLFFYIRDNGLPDEHFTKLFDLMLDATQFLNSQLSAIQEGAPLAEDNPGLIAEADELLALLNGSGSSPATLVAAQAAAALKQTPLEPEILPEPDFDALLPSAGDPAVPDEPDPQPAMPEPVPAEIPAPTPSALDPGIPSTYRVEVLFEEDCGMENLRAYMLVNALSTTCNILDMEPNDIEHNADSSSYILVHGFKLTVETLTPQDGLQSMIERFMHVKTASVIPIDEIKKEDAATEDSGLLAGDRYGVHIRFEDECGMENLRAFMLVNLLRPHCKILDFSPPDIEKNPASASTIIDEGFYINLETPLNLVKLQDLLDNSMYVKNATVHPFVGEVSGKSKPDHQEEAAPPAAPEDTTGGATAPEQAQPAPAPVPPPEPEAKTPEETQEIVPAKFPTAPPVASGKPVKQNLINVSLSKLDELMDIVGELVITESMVVRSPDLKHIAKLDHFQKATRQMMKLTSELQDTVMSIRMIPVAGTFHKMQRIVRDMCRNLGKEADLITMGEDIDIDKTIIDGIADPIMHLVRNAMDHGVELPEERKAAGKPRKATVVLSAQNTGGEILVTISDDGKGLDAEKILEKAKKAGILQKPVSDYTDKEAYMLLCAPGFSTKDQITEYSGRGVGMDVVKKNIEKIGGSVYIESKKGHGMIVFLKIPLTLAIVDGMEISVGGDIFTLQIAAINESFKATSDQVIVDTEGNEMILVRGNVYPIIRLHELYDIPGAVTKIEDGILIWVQVGDRSACLLVDELIGEHQIVVKPLPVYLNRFDIKSFGISGCTILGDGNISLILDAAGIIEKVLEKR